MISTKILPAHILRLYIWELLKNNTNMTTVDGLVPVIPIEDEPKLQDSGKSYLIYGYAEQTPTRLPEMRRGTFSLRIIARDFGDLGWITNVIIRAFENSQFAAENINLWSSQFTDGELVGIRFTSAEVSYVEGGSAPDTESGPSEGLVNIAFQYITQQDVKTFDGTEWV